MMSSTTLLPLMRMIPSEVHNNTLLVRKSNRELATFRLPTPRSTGQAAAAPLQQQQKCITIGQVIIQL